MTESHNETESPEQGTDSGGSIEVGERLRKAREEAGTDINEMAGRLRLTSLQLQDIEEGRLETFGASIYARGYVANYARLVGLKPEPLLERLGLDDEEPPLTAAAAAAPAPGQRMAENIIRVASYAVGTVVLALPVLWWASEGSLDALFGSPTPAPAQQEAAVDAEGEAVAKAVASKQQPAEAEPERSGDQPLMASMGMVRSTRDAGPEPASGEAAPAAEDNAGETVAPAPARLVLEVSEDAWVEIRDNAGERLEYDLLKAATSHEYSGQPPYRVLIGNAGAVTVRYNDAPFDLAPFVQGNLARFEVGEKPAGG